VTERNGDSIEVESLSGPVRFLLAAAKPLNEPMQRYGPFVMNTMQEIHQAFEDFQSGKLQE
jgi:redox-sensitive bicupin YhaK (pirin superfamily)